MVEIDEELVEMCQEYLPEMSNCTDMIGSDADSCFDDSWANLVFEDAFQYFIDNFAENGNSIEMEKFDIIIMDALDPDKVVEIAGALYKDNHFVNSLYNGLTDEGVVSLSDVINYHTELTHINLSFVLAFLVCSSTW